MADVLRSGLLEGLGIEHGFNLRTGGASAAPFDSLNLGRAVGDAPEAVLENHRRFAASVGYPDGGLYEVSQVHGNAVCVIETPEDPVTHRKREADALLAPPGGTAIGVRVADCVPVLLADPDSGTVAAVHSGWRGTVRGVLEAALEAFSRRGVEPARLHAAIFPHIRRCCFEVGDDVARELAAVSNVTDVVDRSRVKPHVDLTAIVAAKLAGAGVPRAQIDDVGGCTRCEPSRFFSYRRDGKRSGRHLAAIVSR